MLGHAFRDFEKQSRRRLQNVRLVHDRDFFPSVQLGIFEGVLRDALAPLASHDRHRLRHRAPVTTDLERVIEADVESFGVFANDDEVDVLVSSAGHDRLGRPHVGVEIELLPQRDIHRPITAADWSREGTFET